MIDSWIYFVSENRKLAFSLDGSFKDLFNIKIQKTRYPISVLADYVLVYDASNKFKIRYQQKTKLFYFNCFVYHIKVTVKKLFGDSLHF